MWKPIKIDARYEVSNDGQVRKQINATHPERNKPYVYLRQQTDRDGYKKVNINRKNYLVHRLVFESFVGPLTAGLVVCHRNNDRASNRPENLLQATQKENIGHKKLHGTWQSAERHPNAKITNEMARQIKNELHVCPRSITNRIKKGTATNLSNKYNVPVNIIYRIARGGYADA